MIWKMYVIILTLEKHILPIEFTLCSCWEIPKQWIFFVIVGNDYEKLAETNHSINYGKYDACRMMYAQCIENQI